ncbi:putative glycosyl group 1 family protein [Phaeomoniella chlamydospora]|uniref:Putative glycosyl group 1 family protein n=1 Tax=Phaeomoniella chlamydospora TaxID=158046 RepID=A0A0G2GGS4_PHACM|nr:putative glycosyl group 1 family protein [Phaeomoniella chlamydospora]
MLTIELLDTTFSEELGSFGVFLGSFENPPTLSQARLLSNWDILVLDPLQDGVLRALSTCQSSSKQILGRLDVRTLTKSDRSQDSDQVVRSLGILDRAITNFKTPQGVRSPFTGVLLAGFQMHFQPAILNEVAKYIKGLGLGLWLEMSPLSYLSERECRGINMELISGIVYRNGTIRSDGDRQNYFQMTEMRTAMRVVAAQRVSHGPPIMLWETVDDEAELQYAIVQRSFNWCRYNSALCWIGHAAALTDAEAAAAQTVADKPLGALMWLNGDDVMKAHDIWRSNGNISQTSCGHDALYDSLQSFIPDLSDRLRLLPPSNNVEQVENEIDIIACRPSQTQYCVPTDPLSTSVGGDDFKGLGCFHLGLEVTPKAFADLVEAQRNLKDLDLLQRVKPEELRRLGEQIEALQYVQSTGTLTSAAYQAVRELLDLLRITNDDGNPLLQVYVGLHSGFQTSSKTQFWGLYEVDPISEGLHIYVSGKTQDRAGTILHTFLSSRGCSRSECLMAEFALSVQNHSLSETWHLPTRIVHDVEQLSPTETILFLQRLVFLRPETDSFLLARLRACCKYQLMDVPTLSQLRALNSTAYLRGEASAESLVTSRVAWFQERGCWHPDVSASISLFKEIETRLHDILMNGQSDLLAQLGVVIQGVMKRDQIDAGADIFALAVFCAFRSLALDEIYLEVLDRNPYPNHTTDQAGCFAENFALGSRCDSFFDMTPRNLGRIISDRYRVYYMKHQPPPREEGFTELPTAYASMQIDLDPQDGQEVIPAYYKITFLGIFALPALIDIMMLTTVGRGLYLTTYMTSTEKTMATTALMLALLTCGAVGSWISSGGSYYLYANAFPAMNMFVLTRFVAGIAIALVGGLGGMIAIMVVKGITAGLIFVFYFTMLTTYLLTLSALSIYQLPGSRFQSGRTVIMTRISILFISPIVSVWVQHDIAVYFCVLTCFLISLLLGARKIISQWGTWYLNIPCVTDSEVVNWYITKQESESSANLSETMKDIGTMPQPRKELHDAVLKEHNRHFWTRSTTNSLEKRLADGYASTMFLMSWYCKHKRTRMPLPYSATWNLTLKAALENMTNMQKGLKLHSAFLHWRHTGHDIWAGILYFVVALLDKWAALVSGGGLVGLSAASSTEYRLAVGFGLCYYLIGAVSLDAVSQPLWTAANQATVQPITSLEFLQQATINDKRARRVLYWKSLAKFFFMHIWGISITSALMWVFESSRSATTMYLAYIGAYTGLLWYQYNKIYCGNKASKCLTVAAIVGLPIGIALHMCLPHFPFSGVIALSIGTWIAAIHSIWMSNIGWPIFSRYTSSNESDYKDDVNPRDKPVFYCSSGLDPCPVTSQENLSKLFESVRALPADLRYTLDPSLYPGVRVMEIFRYQSNLRRSDILQHAFPSADQMLQKSCELWRNGEIAIELVSAREFPQPEQKIRALSCKSGDRLHIFVILGLDIVGDQWTLNIERNCQIVAEAIFQAICEARLGFSHAHSLLAELLMGENSTGEELFVPEGIKRRLETSATDRAQILDNCDNTLLRYLLLGLDCEREWDNQPKVVRSFLLKRCFGQSESLSASVASWIHSRFCVKHSIDVEEYVARCNLGATLTVSINTSAKALEGSRAYIEQRSELSDPNYKKLYRSLPLSSTNETGSRLHSLKHCLIRFHQKLQVCVKFLIISLVADPEYQRELDYKLRGKPLFLHWPLTFFLNGVWSFCNALQRLLLPLVLFHGRETVSRLNSNMKGMKTVIEKHRIVIESLSGPSTCFLTSQPDGSSRLSQYAGRHDNEPAELTKLMAINTYTDKLILRQREEYCGQTISNLFTYDYAQTGKRLRSKLPIQRRCLEGDLKGQIVQYDHRGYITTGSTFRGVNPVKITYWYRKSAKFEDELLRGEYVFPHITIRVSWSMPPRNHPRRLDEWLPFTKVTEATFIQGSEVHHASWSYEHKFHPEISTTLNGNPVGTPPMIAEDWFHVLQKPDRCGFLSDNPLLSFSSVNSNFVSRLLRLNIKRYPIPTSHARTQLWKLWKTGRELDAITARWLDEGLLRSDGVLNSYWRNRDLGRLDAAKEYLDAQADTVMARVDVDPEISSWVHIAFKISDLYGFGQGGDSRINTRTLSTQLRDSDDELHILAMDTSTWPNEPGGVSACRRDLVNDLHTIKWHIVAECANDYGVPRFQIERNVQSLTVLPLWGLDFLNPTHGVLQNSLDSAVVQRSYDTTTADIKKNFLPILTSLVRCTRTVHLTRQHIEEATQALVDLNTYFEESRNWNDVWSSNIVKQKWRELWLTEDMEDTLKVSQWWDFEKPTMLQLDEALNMWHRYLFIFSIPVPEKIPDVFQASHHFTGATYGILCKVKRQCTLHVWDHCISFRELTTFMSSAVSFDTPFVNSSLISLGHLSCVLLEHHADVVLPCAEYFNPGWEVELGTADGALEHRRTFARKIDPVVNGICNMEKFEPIKTIKTDKPTVVMLSHIQYVKDIKNAIMATDLIVNKWGFTDYRLHVYGDMERAASHSTECQELIASKGLREHCILKGLGNPSVVLQDAWLFLNSSISEGLPLAMGEAALTGVPVVCTDVGASFCVVTDRSTGDRFSEVVPPNDAESLARAQLSVMGLLGKWSAYAEDAPGTSPPVLAYPNPTPDQVAQITQRMYEKTERRRRLGMLGRENVLKNFSSERYLREHEQMLWIGKYRSPNYQLRKNLPPSSYNSSPTTDARIMDIFIELTREKGANGPNKRTSSQIDLLINIIKHAQREELVRKESHTTKPPDQTYR